MLKTIVDAVRYMIRAGGLVMVGITQLEYAAALGISVPAGITKGRLSEMISQATGK